MELEKRSGELAKYNERWNGGVFEVMVYSGMIKADIDFTCPYPSYAPRYNRCLILPLPPDFDWTELTNIKSFPDSILIVEDFGVGRWKRKGRKNIRPLSVFLRNPGRTSVRIVKFTGGIGPKAKIWISERTFKKITKRNLYVDKFYAEQIFSKGRSIKDI